MFRLYIRKGILMNKNMLLQNLTMKNNPPHPAKSLALVGRIILKYKPLPLYGFKESIGEKFIICLSIAHVCKHMSQ